MRSYEDLDNDLRYESIGTQRPLSGVKLCRNDNERRLAARKFAKEAYRCPCNELPLSAISWLDRVTTVLSVLAFNAVFNIQSLR